VKKWAIRFLAYPVVFILAAIFISPTIPIDISILIISAIVAWIGLSDETAALHQVRLHITAWRSKIISKLKA